MSLLVSLDGKRCKKPVVALRKFPFLRLLLYLIGGILLGTFCPTIPSWVWVAVGVPLLAAFLVWSRFDRYAPRPLFGMAVCSLLFALGSYGVERQRRQLVDSFEDSRGDLLFQLVDVPLEKPKSVQILANMLPDSSLSGVSVQFYVKKDSSSLALKDGDWIAVNPKALRKRPPTVLSDFDYDAYLRGKGISGSFYLPDYRWRFVSHTESFSVFRLARATQKKMVDVFRKCGVGEAEIGVLAALTIGDKTMLDRDLKRSYSLTGASHILAVSGLHVGVVFFVFVWFLSVVLRGDRFQRLRILLSLLALWGYAFVSGLSPSVVRAAIMLTVASASTLFRRRSKTYNALFASAFMMLVYSPRYLFDVSFQLSYVAVLSILMFQKPLEQMLEPKHPWMGKCWSLLTVSLAAQLGTLPLVLYYFHQASNIFWLSGFVVIPLATVVIYMSFVLWALHWVPYLSVALAFCLGKIVWLMNASIRWMEGFYGAVRESVAFGVLDAAALYLLLSALFVYVQKNTAYRLMMLLSLSVVYVSWQTVEKFF